MKICTITCSNANNHGARLQCYALAKWLQQQGHVVEVIDYRPHYMRAVKLIYWPKLTLRSWAKLIWEFKPRLISRLRRRAFDAFTKQYIPITNRIYSSVEELRADPPQADMYIAGSDQIWNTTFPNGSDPAFYLDFGPKDVLRESFAASFGISEIDDAKLQFVKDQLQKFDKITIREQSSIPMVESWGFPVSQQEDPVFLLSRGEWETLADETGKGESYIFVYDFFQGEDIKLEAIRLAKQRGLKIFALGSKPLSYADRNFVFSRPETFLGLIRYATIVVSNSFHATAFAMIFNVPYVVVDRQDGQNIRMRDLEERHKQSSFL